MDPVEVKLPIHENHAMMPLKDVRKGDCCGIKFQGVSDGFYCDCCDYFFHKPCSNPPKEIKYPSHECYDNTIRFTHHFEKMRCAFCRVKIMDYNLKVYECSEHKDFVIHVECARYPPPEVIDFPHGHEHHQLKLEKVESCFKCVACGEDGDGYSYKCHERDLTFHVNCGKYPAEVNHHPSHSLHPLKLYNGEPPAYTDGKCSLCGYRLDEAFYHCSTCNFTLDLDCVHNPPPLFFHDRDTHEHNLTLLPKSISFTCTTCGLKGDRSPYVCLQCSFTAHNDCFGFPWVININRHDHRVSRISLLGVVNSKCGVCQKKMDWSCGGYSCKRCPNSVFHTKCATRKDVWDGEKLKDEPEEDEDMEPFEVVGGNTIRHILHYKHNLRLDKSCIFVDESRCCWNLFFDNGVGQYSGGFFEQFSCRNDRNLESLDSL